MHRVRSRRVVWLSVLLALPACAAPLAPRFVEGPQPGVRAVERVDRIFDYQTALATISAIFERELGFPRFPVRLEFYADSGAFERALLATGYDPALARSTATTMVAIGGYRTVLLNDRHLSEMPWRERLVLLAHELAHSVQYELGGGTRGASDQWLREGFCEWVAVRVMERLHAASLAEVRRQRQAEVRRAGRHGLARLTEMSTFPQWVRVGERLGPTPYAQAFLAADFLIERHGLAAVVRYFESFAAAADPEGNFRAAFGESRQDFEAALNGRTRSR